MPCGGLLDAWRGMEPCERVLIPSALVKDELRMLRWLPAAMLSSSSKTFTTGQRMMTEHVYTYIYNVKDTQGADTFKVGKSWSIMGLPFRPRGCHKGCCQPAVPSTSLTGAPEGLPHRAGPQPAQQKGHITWCA